MTTTDQIQALHESYCTALNLPLPINSTFERWWYESLKLGLTPEHVEMVIASRLKWNREHRGHEKGMELKHLIRSEDDVAVVLNECAVVLSQRRVKVMEPSKASVLRATGRSDEPPQTDARVVGELMENLRKAAQ